MAFFGSYMRVCLSSAAGAALPLLTPMGTVTRLYYVTRADIIKCKIYSLRDFACPQPY